MTNAFCGPHRGFADFLSCMLSDVTGLACSFVHVVGSILASRYTNTENQGCRSKS
jgi:hypothetical protein